MKISLVCLILIQLAFLTACQLPATGIPPSTIYPEADYTQAVLTIVAGYTQAAQTPAVTIQPDPVLPTQNPVNLPTDTQTLVITVPPQPSATQSVTLTPTRVPPTVPPSLAASDPRLGLGDPTFHDSFDDC